MLLKTCYSFSP